MVFMWAKYLQRNALSFSGAGGRCGASCLYAGGHSLFSTHTAHRWEWKNKKPPHSAITKYRNGKGLLTTFQVLHSLSTPGYLQSNLEVLRRPQRPKLFIICHYQAWEGDTQSASKGMQPCCICGPHHHITPNRHGSPTGYCGGTAAPYEQGQVNSKAQAKNDIGNSWALRKGDGCSAGVALGCPPCPGAAAVQCREHRGCSCPMLGSKQSLFRWSKSSLCPEAVFLLTV